MSGVALTLLFSILLIGLPIGFVLVLACGLEIWLRGLPDMLLAQRLFTGLDSFPIMAVPLFVLAGDLMCESGITNRIIALADALVGHVKTGLCQVTIVSAVIFSGISGSAVADASALGRVFIPSMEEAGYRRDYAAALIAAAGVLGPMIPPSIPMVIYSLIVQLSVGALFLAGTIPGFALAFALGGIARITGPSRGGNRTRPRRSRAERLAAWRGAILPLAMPAIVLGGILGGVVTPTEAAAIAVLYSLVVGLFVLRTLRCSALPRIFATSMMVSAAILFIMGSANIINWLLTTEQVPQRMAAWVIGTVESPALYLLLVNLMLLIVGCLIEGLAAMVVLVPILFPIAQQLGIDPLHFATVVVFNLMIGLITPPMGLLLFVADGIARTGLAPILRQLWPFLIAEIVVLIAVTYIPSLSTFLPALAGYGR